jgi:hypothetical protein
MRKRTQSARAREIEKSRIFPQSTREPIILIVCSLVARAFARGENPDLVSYLAERAKLFGLIKAERK